MITKKRLKALKILTERLHNKGINWAVVGSTNLVLQGVKIAAKDIDILTDKKGAFLIGNLFKEYTIKPVKYKKSERFNSYYGLFEIEGVKVEVMGNLQNKIPKGDLWSEKSSLSKKVIIKLKKLKIPAISLQQEYLAYSKMGREEKAKRIKKFLDKQ